MPYVKKFENEKCLPGADRKMEKLNLKSKIVPICFAAKSG